MKTYYQFINAQYAASPTLQRYYGSEARYRDHYIANHGFGEWLESLRGQSLSLPFTIRLAKIFLVHGGRSPDTLHMVLASISRQYDVELPVVGGILTADYWRRIANHRSWMPLKAAA